MVNNCGKNTTVALEESLAYLRTLANFGGTLIQSKQLAQKGLDKVEQILKEKKMNTGTKVTTGATATTHDIELDDAVLEQIIRESRNSDGTLEFARRIARAAIEADRKRSLLWDYCPECGNTEYTSHVGCGNFCTNCGQEWHSDIDYSEAVQKNLSDHKRRGSIVNNASASSEPVAYVSGGFRRIYNGPGDWYNVGTIILCDDSPEATLPAGTNLYTAPQPLSESDIPTEPVNNKASNRKELLLSWVLQQCAARRYEGGAYFDNFSLCRLRYILGELDEKATQPDEPSDSLPRHVAQTLATAIYETAQKMGIANGDHSALSVPQCLHLLDCMVQPAEPVKKKDWNVELSSWSDEDFIQVFHERPDLADRLRRVLSKPVKVDAKASVPSDDDIEMLAVIKAYLYEEMRGGHQLWTFNRQHLLAFAHALLTYYGNTEQEN